MNTITSTIHKIEETMSKWLTGALALVATIATGDAAATETKQAITDLQEKLADDEADAAEQKQVIDAILAKLAVSTPPADTGDAGSGETGGESNN